MPRKTPATRRHRGKLTKADSSYLRFGYAWLGAPSFNPNDPQEVAEAWEAWGAEIMAQWLLQPQRSGGRPWAWWRVEQGRDKPKSHEEDEAQMLRDLGELTPKEEEILAAWEAERVARFGNVEESHAMMRRLNRERLEREEAKK